MRSRAVKHHIVRAARRIRSGDHLFQPGDVVGHVMSVLPARHLGNLVGSNPDMVTIESRDCEEFDCDHTDDEDPSGEPSEGTDGDSGDGEPGGQEGGDPNGEGGGDSGEGSSDDAQGGGGDDEDTIDSSMIVAELVEAGLSQGVAEELAASAVGNLPAEDLVPDHEELGTLDGIRTWREVHGDLTQIAGIGAKRAKEIERVLAAG